MNQTIIDAINQRRQMSIWWQGGVRIVQPHTYGINTARHQMLSCWQLSGHSRSNCPTGWKPLLVDAARDFVILEQTFDPHWQYRPDDKRMIQIFAQIQI